MVVESGTVVVGDGVPAEEGTLVGDVVSVVDDGPLVLSVVGG
jgi:hypothetical protein